MPSFRSTTAASSTSAAPRPAAAHRPRRPSLRTGFRSSAIHSLMLGLVSFAVASLSGGSVAAASAADPWPYVWPVDAPVVDGFRAPANRFAAGNRGLEFATTAGQVVVAPRRGVVTFAGPVAGGRFVTVLHPDGVRTTAGFLRSVSVSRGQVVATGQTIGTAAVRLHVSARIGDSYVDPAVLFGGAGGPPRLVMVTSGPARVSERGSFGGRFESRWSIAGRVASSRLAPIRLHSRLGAGTGA